MERNEIIANLMNNGATKFAGLKVKNVTVTPQESYVRVALTLDKEVPGYVTKDNGTTYELETTKVVFISLFSIISILKDDDDAAFAANHLIANPQSMAVILSGAKIDMLQEKVTAGTSYKNPWSESAEEVPFDHDAIIPHIISIKLTDKAKQKLDKIADAMLGI